MLVVYGYHWYEKFAVDVGRRLASKVTEPNLNIVEYAGAPDFPSRVDIRYQKPTFPNFWKFVRRLKPSYVIDLHSGFPSNEKAESNDNEFVSNEAVDVTVYSKERRIDPTFRSRLNEYRLHWYENLKPFIFGAHYCPNFRYVPRDTDKLVIEFLPPRIKKAQATKLVMGLARLL